MSSPQIIATVGPATKGLLQELQDSGVSIFRLNFSHGTHTWHQEVIEAIRNLKNEAKIMLDTKGPEIRTGVLHRDFSIKKGDRITLVTNESAQNEKNKLIYCDYQDLPKSVELGNIIQFCNGEFLGIVQSIHQSSVVVEIQSDAILGSRKHVNLPGVRVNLPTISKKDEADLLFGKKLGVDIVALSFVRHARDILKAREILGEGIEIVAKIECEEGVKNFQGIANAADGIMIARGDLGVEMGITHLPVLQKKMLRDVKKDSNTYSVVATGLLRSMVHEKTPHRAEVSDIATAVWEGADYVMLSDETTVGKYPLEVIRVLNEVIEYSKEYV